MYVKVQFVPRSKHSPSQLLQNQSDNSVYKNTLSLYRKPHKTQKESPWAERKFFNNKLVVYIVTTRL